MKARSAIGCVGVAAAAMGSLITVLGCQGNISPQPEPPVRQGPTVDFGAVKANVNRYVNAPSGLRGAPGSASPAGATLRAVNLDDSLDPVETIVADDGSFEVLMSLSLGDEVRVQLLDGGTRSEPVDVEILNDEAPPVLATHALGDCLTLTPSAEISLVSGVGTVRVRNDCNGAVQLGAPYLRRSINGLEIGQNATWPMTVDVGATADVVIRWSSGGTEEIVFIEARAPASDRRAVTVRPSSN